MAEEHIKVNLPAVQEARPSAVYDATRQVVDVIRTAVSNPKLDVRKMREIMDMQMEMMRFQAELAYNAAMNACQGEIPQIETNKRNDHTKSNYANLEGIDTIIRPITRKHGFSLEFDTEHMEGGVNIICWVRHVDGHKERRTLAGNLDLTGSQGKANKTSIQGTGSTVSYLQRYLTKLIFNIIIKGEDTDGNKDKPDAKPQDEFAAAVRGDHGGNQKLLDDAEALIVKLSGLGKKADRIALINGNLPLIQALAKDGHEKRIQELHALADKGA